MKKVVLIARLFCPHVGGVEKQLEGFCKEMLKRDYHVVVITEQYDNNLKREEVLHGVGVIRISYPKIPFLGLLVIWIKLLFRLKLFFSADLFHSFGSFVWLLPIRITLFWKRYYSTFFGWEGKYPIPWNYKFLRRLANCLSKKTVADAGFIEEYYDIKVDKLRYASADSPCDVVSLSDKKKKVVYVGRLDEDTGLKKILSGLALLNNISVDFCGDGKLSKECSKYGKVYGFVNPVKFYRKASICLSPGHTSIIESFFYKCLVVTTYNNRIKKDYLLMTPFKDWIVVEKDPEKLAEKIKYYLDHPEKAKPMIEAAHKWVQGQTWEKMADTYEELWGVKRSKV